MRPARHWAGGLLTVGPGALTGKYRQGTNVPGDSRAANRSIKAEVTVGDYLHDELLEKVEQLQQIAGEMGIPLARLALAWVLRQPNVSSALVGASRPQQIEENVKASGTVIPDEIMRKIEDVLRVPSYVVKHNIVV